MTGEAHERERPRGLRSPRRLVKLALVAAFAILVAGGIRAARKMYAAKPLAGVELGMNIDEVRSSFEPPASGFFMVGSEGGEPLLEWHPRGRGNDAPVGVRFHFHEGALDEARFGWRPGTRPAEAAQQIHLPPPDSPDAHTWELGAGEASLHRLEGGVVEIVYSGG